MSGTRYASAAWWKVAIGNLNSFESLAKDEIPTAKRWRVRALPLLWRRDQQPRWHGHEPKRNSSDLLLENLFVNITLTLPLRTSTRDSHSKTSGKSPRPTQSSVMARAQYSSCRFLIWEAVLYLIKWKSSLCHVWRDDGGCITLRGTPKWYPFAYLDGHDLYDTIGS